MNGVSYYDEVSSKLVGHATEFLHKLGVAPKSSDVIERVVILALIFIVAYLTYLIFNKFVIRILHCIVSRAKRKWGILLYENNFFHRLFGLIPPLVILLFAPLPFRDQSSVLLEIIEKGSYIYLIVMFVKLIFSSMNTLFYYFVKEDDDGYQSYKSAIEIIKIFLVVFALLVIVGVVTGQKITTMIAGLSAFAAVLLLIFKDTLLGFIAGIQLAQNKMIKLGDWVQMDQYGANGTVFEMSLITIKIRNFDNTIVTVPPYSFISSSFINWKGMSETGFRRIKKTILFDINTIKRIDDSFIDKIKDNPLLGGYLNPEYMDPDPKRCKEQDKSTNMGLYRIWLEHYLMHHPHVRHDQYLIIQGNESDGGGYPLLVMFFIDTTVWETYEIIQSRIFEEIMTVYPVFELAPYQFAGMLNPPAQGN
ncbi:MAG: mechanosensitive ion channel family protein [Bacteroidales bacterium]